MEKNEIKQIRIEEDGIEYFVTVFRKDGKPPKLEYQKFEAGSYAVMLEGEPIGKLVKKSSREWSVLNFRNDPSKSCAYSGKTMKECKEVVDNFWDILLAGEEIAF